MGNSEVGLRVLRNRAYSISKIFANSPYGGNCFEKLSTNLPPSTSSLPSTSFSSSSSEPISFQPIRNVHEFFYHPKTSTSASGGKPYEPV